MSTTGILLVGGVVCFLILFILYLAGKSKKRTVINALQDNSINKIVSINGLCDAINASDDLSQLNILKLMGLSLSSFSNVSHLIKNNPQDVREKVKKVYIKSNMYIFNFFRTCVYKEYSADSPSIFGKQIFFYTNTDNVDEILRIYSIVTDKFGDCLVQDGDKPFTRQNLEDISMGFVILQKDECHAVWLFKDLTFRLQYHTNPPKQFVINIMQK